MTDYKNKKFQLQKELESVYYGLAERTLKTTKTAEEEFLQKSDELKNSVSFFAFSFKLYLSTLLHDNALINMQRGNISENKCFTIPIGAVHFRALCQALNEIFGE